MQTNRFAALLRNAATGAGQSETQTGTNSRDSCSAASSERRKLSRLSRERTDLRRSHETPLQGPRDLRQEPKPVSWPGRLFFEFQSRRGGSGPHLRNRRRRSAAHATRLPLAGVVGGPSIAIGSSDSHGAIAGHRGSASGKIRPGKDRRCRSAGWKKTQVRGSSAVSISNCRWSGSRLSSGNGRRRDMLQTITC